MKTPLPPWLMGTLLVSLALNFFLGGLFFSRTFFAGPALIDTPPTATSGESAPGTKRGAGNRGLMKLLRQAPELVEPAQRPALEALLNERLPEIGGQIKQLRRNRQQLRQQLTAEKLDRAALMDTFHHLQNHSRTARTAMHDLVLTVTERLNDEQRQELFSHLRHGRRGMGRHRNRCVSK